MKPLHVPFLQAGVNHVDGAWVLDQSVALINLELLLIYFVADSLNCESIDAFNGAST